MRDAVGAAVWTRYLSGGNLPWAVRIPPGDEETFRAAVHGRWIDDIAVADCDVAPFSAARGPREIAATAGDYYVVWHIRAGELDFRQRRTHRRLGAGEVLAWESRHPARVTVREPAAVRSVLVPRAILEDVGCRLRVGEPLAGEAPTARLLHGYLDLLGAVSPALPGAATVAARNALLEMVWAALQPEASLDPLALHAARRAAVDRYMEARLDHEDLSAETVAAAHNISVRTLGRLFTETGETFTGVLRAKRVARVREELLVGDATVAALARRWGFFDTSHLNRRFRAVHGLSPQEYRRRGLAERRQRTS